MENSTTHMEETVTVDQTLMRWDFNSGWSVCAEWGSWNRVYPPVGGKVISFQVTVMYENDPRKVFPSINGDTIGWVNPSQLATILKEASQAFPDVVGEVLLKESFDVLFKKEEEPAEKSWRVGSK
jgi:hypothetical protein